MIADLDGRDKELLLEHSGELLKALEHLAFRALRLEPVHHEKIHLDCGGYRALRFEELRMTARVDGAVQAGVVSARLNWAKFGAEKKNINVLTSEKLTDIGNSATFYSVLVEVELVQPLS